MNEELEIIGPEDPYFKNLPMGFRMLYEQVQTEQWRIWRAAGSPKPANDKLMKQIDAVMWNAWKSDLGMRLQKANEYLPAEFISMLSNHQHYEGMLNAADLIPTL